MKDRDYYMTSKNPIWDLTHDIAMAGFDHDWQWLGELKAACQSLEKQYPTNGNTYQTLLRVATALDEIATKRKQVHIARH